MMNDGGALPPEVGATVNRSPGAGASFRCAACTEMAADVWLVPAGAPVRVGPPFGKETYERDGVVVDHLLGTTS